MSISLATFNLNAIQSTVNEWLDRENRPLTWHKIQLVLHKVALDLQRLNEVTVVDYGGAAGVLNVTDGSKMIADAGGSVVNVLASLDIENASIKWSTLIYNVGAETITYQESDGTPIGTLATTETKILYWTGTAWGISAAL